MNIIVVVEHRPLFRVINHILAGAAETERVVHIRSLKGLKNSLAKEQLAEKYDVVLMEAGKSYDEALALLRARWPEAAIGLLVHDIRLIKKRAQGFDGLLDLAKMVRNLIPWIQRTIPMKLATTRHKPEALIFTAHSVDTIEKQFAQL